MLQLNTNGAEFIKRHIGPSAQDTEKMLDTIGIKSVDELIEKTIPTIIRSKKPMNIPEGLSEFEMLQSLKNRREKYCCYQFYWTRLLWHYHA